MHLFKSIALASIVFFPYFHYWPLHNQHNQAITTCIVQEIRVAASQRKSL